MLKAALGGTALLSTLGSSEAQMSHAFLDGYKPLYFSTTEWAFIRAACARLIPSEGEGPGALEARVPVFIDTQMAGDFGKASDWYMLGPHEPGANPLLGFQSPLTPAQIYRQSIALVDEWCTEQKGKAFAELGPDLQDEVLRDLQARKMPLKAELRDFFVLLLQNTKEGYFADPIYGGNYRMAAWKYIGFPGARGAYLEWANDKGAPYPLGPVSISGDRG
ncbi:gluconate 2-dehydrogenase gamma chain [Bradyrhizobium huanghuaihaiense]|nr:gluconate 2-dehydrogenase subunit 3 family protein [Bradyrhizobium huanghuaihaiense]